MLLKNYVPLPEHLGFPTDVKRVHREIDTIIIHCSASSNGGLQSSIDVDLWHRNQGLRRNYPTGGNPNLNCIGYHYVIPVHGFTEAGRGILETGWHTRNYNKTSIGVCLIGTDKYTKAQWTTLKILVQGLIRYIIGPKLEKGGKPYPPNPTNSLAQAEDAGIIILGHCDFPGDQTDCPGFSVSSWLAAGMQPLLNHML